MSTPNVKSADSFREYWDKFSAKYARDHQSQTVPVAITMLTPLRLSDKSVMVLEVGAGPGGDTEHLMSVLAPGSRAVITDLSPSMIDINKARMAPLEEGLRQRDLTIEFALANGEDLSAYANASFDRYLANLCLFMAPDTDKMLRESRRVLAPGGIAAFSVWGRRENSPMFTFHDEIKQELGIPLDTTRSNFHLNDMSALRQRVESAGYSKTVAWYHPLVAAVQDAAEFADIVLAGPSVMGLFQKQPEIKDEYCQRYRAKLKAWVDGGRPIGFEAMCVMAFV